MLLFVHQCKNNLIIFEIKIKFFNKTIIKMIFIQSKKNKSKKSIKSQIIIIIIIIIKYKKHNQLKIIKKINKKKN